MASRPYDPAKRRERYEQRRAGNASAGASAGDAGSGVGGDGDNILDPAAALGAGAGNTAAGGNDEPRRRGRPAGTGGSRAGGKTPSSLAVNSLAATIEQIHGMLAALVHVPQLAIGPEQSRDLATALAVVSEHYKLPAVSADKIALASLIWTAGRIYIPIALSINSAPAAQSAQTAERAINPEHATSMYGDDEVTRAAKAAQDFFSAPNSVN